MTGTSAIKWFTSSGRKRTFSFARRVFEGQRFPSSQSANQCNHDTNAFITTGGGIGYATTPDVAHESLHPP